jgi:undecaprenyl pyrophosphate synthase
MLNRHNTKAGDNQSSFKSSPKLKINFLSYSQGGKSMLVNTCKYIATKVKEDKLKLEDINQELVDNRICGKLIFIHGKSSSKIE